MSISFGLVLIVVTAVVAIYRGISRDWNTVALCLIALALLAG